MRDTSPSPRPFPVRQTVLGIVALAAFFIYTYFVRDVPGPEALDLRGATMGTTYQIRTAGSTLTVDEVASLRTEVERYLERINQAMSTYRPDSDISRFNAYRDTDPVAVSPELVRVTWYALELAQLSHGAFDPTLGPVIDLWGFGSAEPPDGAPAPEEVAKALARTGADLIEVVDGLHLAKKRPDAELNLSAVAKGFAVDGLSLLLGDHGLTNTYVEIGGEIVVRGVNSQGTPWRIGVDLPEPGAYPGEHVVCVVTPGDKAIATSGDYRNYRVDPAGRRRSHLINPATGFPVAHRLASVSVVASSCMAADGIATTLMIMGEEAGMAWIATQPHAEALFIIRNDAGAFDVRQSTGFDAYLAE